MLPSHLEDYINSIKYKITSLYINDGYENILDEYYSDIPIDNITYNL